MGTQTFGGLDFGNVCLGAGGGKTLGFWSNKNGQAQMNDGRTMVPELQGLSVLNLRTASGGHLDPGTYAQFRTWILGTTATNMANMLLAQLAAMWLNREAGSVSGGSFVHAPGCGNTGLDNAFISIDDVITAANASLGANGNTTAAGAIPDYQECLKNALDNANNNLNFVQAGPCI